MNPTDRMDDAMTIAFEPVSAGAVSSPPMSSPPVSSEDGRRVVLARGSQISDSGRLGGSAVIDAEVELVVHIRIDESWVGSVEISTDDALSSGLHPPSRTIHHRSDGLAQDNDPMRSLLTVARMVRGAVAGVALRADGGYHALPGYPAHALLGARSPVLAAAHDCVGDGKVCSSFLWPTDGFPTAAGHLRVTVLAAPEEAPSGLTALALLSPVADLHGLTPRELEVLGLLVEGCSNRQIARTLVVAPRTVAAHLEHVLEKLRVPTRTLAAVRAERDGLYVPSPSRRS